MTMKEQVLKPRVGSLAAMRRRFNRDRSWRRACGLSLAACLVVFAAPACDKMPLVAPTDTTITLYASSTSVGLNSSTDITATVIESAGTPVQNGTVVTFSTTLGTLSPVEGRTSAGKVTVKLSAGSQSGVAEIRAYSGGANTAEALKISVGAAAAGKVELLASPSSLPAAGGVVQLTAVVTDASGNRLAGVPVSFTTDAGQLAQSSVVSDGTGEARTSLSMTAKAKVTASVTGGSGNASLSATVEIPVRIGPVVTISVPAGNLVPGVASSFTITVTAGGAAVRAASIDFGDGGTQTIGTSGSSSVAHSYSRSGTYVVTATATDVAGETTTATASVNVQAVVVTVTLTAPATASTTAPAEFTATATTSPAGAIIERFEWDFGDNSTASTSGGSTSHIYASLGTFTVKVKAVTTTGASGTAQKQISVQPVTVSVTFTVAPATITVGTPAIFTVTAVTNPVGVPIERYEWDFGDGETRTTPSVVTTHPYTTDKTYTVRVSAVTTTGAIGTAVRDIVVVR